MKRTLRNLTAAALAALALAGAGCGKSPTAPEQATQPPPVQIQTPIEALVSSIAVTKFPATKSDGSAWDLSAIVASRLPDLYVVLQVPGQIPDYTSSTVVNADPSKPHTFNESRSLYDGSLPIVLPYDDSYRIYVMDEDVGGDPDRVGWITVNVPRAYRQDNARDLDYTYTDSGNRLSVRIRGLWKY